MLIAIRPLRIITKRVERLLARSSRHSEGNRSKPCAQYSFLPPPISFRFSRLEKNHPGKRRFPNVVETLRKFIRSKRETGSKLFFGPTIRIVSLEETTCTVEAIVNNVGAKQATIYGSLNFCSP